MDWGYSVWPGLVLSADCFGGVKSAWHWPQGCDTHSLPQRPQTGEETLFGSGQRVSAFQSISSHITAAEKLFVTRNMDSKMQSFLSTNSCTPAMSQSWRGTRGSWEGQTFPQVCVMRANEQLQHNVCISQILVGLLTLTFYFFGWELLNFNFLFSGDVKTRQHFKRTHISLSLSLTE